MRAATAGTIFALTISVALSGCTGGAGVAAPEADNKDGQNFASKPGMARLYIVQGLERQADRPGSGSTVIASGPAGSPMVVGAAAGLAVAGLVNAFRDKPEAPQLPPDPVDPENKYVHNAIPFPNDVAVNGKKVGTIGHLQYVVLDLPPAQYDLKLTQATTWKQPFADMRVDLKAETVTYLMTTELAYGGPQKNDRALVTCQPADCQTYVLAGHRVATDWK